MGSIREFWKELWNEKAVHENMFIQIGRSSYTPSDFFLMVKDICNSLDINRDDIVLDAGGGAGWLSMCIAPFVKEIVLFDYAEGMVEKARELTASFGNIRAEYDDLLFMGKVGNGYTKVIVSSVLQYLESHDQVKTALSNIYNVMTPNGSAIFTHNPDLRKREAHIKSYEHLDWNKKKIKHALKMEEKRLWLDIERIQRIASKIGFSDFYEVPINPKLWQSTHMFDFVVVK